MYSEADLQSAVSAGVLSAEAAEALRSHVATLHATPAVDEEQFRLITGFNDIFVSIACALVIFAAGAVGGAFGDALGGLLVAAAAWAMAEVFTRRRRMALPSIILLLAFVIGVAAFFLQGLEWLIPKHEVHRTQQIGGQTMSWTSAEHYPWQLSVMLVVAGLAAGLAALAHWRRFRVAITIAAAVGALVLVVLGVVDALSSSFETASRQVSAGGPALFGDSRLIAPAALLCGLGCFAYAMRWDMSDPQRRSQRADVAFWLHLLAAPLIAHPLFHWMGVTGGDEVGLLAALGVLVIYLVFAVIALTIDRRALLVSALAYVLFALASLFRTYGAVQLNTALTALVIGSALLTLSAWWAMLRKALVERLPAGLRDYVPGVG